MDADGDINGDDQNLLFANFDEPNPLDRADLDRDIDVDIDDARI